MPGTSRKVLMADDIQPRVLLVTGDADTARDTQSFLERRGFVVEWVSDNEKAFNCLDSRFFDAVVSDLDRERISGMRLMGVALERNPEACVVFMVHAPETERATEAMRQGASDFQTRPLNLEKLEAVIRRGLERQRLVYEQQQLRRRLDERYGLGNLIGQSRQMLHVFDMVRQTAPLDSPVMIVGEEGSGRTLIARTIHNSSVRRDEPFVELDCMGASKELVESELLGFSEGASLRFRGVRAGRLAAADGGTLFLRNIEGLSRTGQDELLNVINKGAFRRLGDEKPAPVDVRIISAAMENLNVLRDSERILLGLAERLGTAIVYVPPLRDRREDIPLLVGHAIEEYARRHGRTAPGITHHAMEVLANYDWPGNVRELMTTIQSMITVAREGATLDINHMPSHLLRHSPEQPVEMRIPIGVPMKDVERIVIEATLRSCGYRKQDCAKKLGIGLRTLYRKIDEYDIR